jgi:hypothetical protein
MGYRGWCRAGGRCGVKCSKWNIYSLAMKKVSRDCLIGHNCLVCRSMTCKE